MTSEPTGFTTLVVLMERLIGAVEGLRADLAEARQTPAVTAPTTDPEELWTAQQVASYLNCSKSWVYDTEAAGRLPSLHVGGLLRFEPAVIKALAKGSSKPGRVLPMRRA